MTHGNDMISRWKEYFQDLYEGTQDIEGIPERLPIREPNGEKDEPPTTEEVLQAIKKLKNNRAPGPDGLNVELIKVDDNKLTHRICKVTEKYGEQKRYHNNGRKD
jgi:hypothetical protein